jgi:ABC-type proline/glycine betaine transport system ATPase subunit
MLVLDRVTRRFGATVAVSDVSIEIQPESFVGVIGRSGAGKSTMLRMINRLIDPTEGRIARASYSASRRSNCLSMPSHISHFMRSLRSGQDERRYQQ